MRGIKSDASIRAARHRRANIGLAFHEAVRRSDAGGYPPSHVVTEIARAHGVRDTELWRELHIYNRAARAVENELLEKTNV